MSRPTHGQSRVLRNVQSGRSLHDDFKGSARSKGAIAKAFDARQADIRVCLDQNWVGHLGQLTLQGEAALARFDKGGADV